MSASTTSIQPFHATLLDDELSALTLQLEELGIFTQSSKGKHAINHPPDMEIAFASFQAELNDYKNFLNDQKFAQSMGAAVHSDGLLIGGLASQDIQSHEDRRVAIEMSNNDPEIEAPPPVTRTGLQHDVEDWMSTISGNIAATSIIEFSDDEAEAGPSMTYTERQADIMTKLSTEFYCVACGDRYPRAQMVSAKCSHRYCSGCVKDLFKKSIKDEELYPPKCCKQLIPLSLISRHMNAEELAAFEFAQVEYATRDKTYCSNRECGIFVVPDNIQLGTNRATCSECETDTCTMCKNCYHPEGPCPDDPALQEAKDLARELGWQTCIGCDRIVQLRTGCNHMT